MAATTASHRSPAASDATWCKNPVDRFVLARLEKEKDSLPKKAQAMRKEWNEEREALSSQITAAYQARDEFRTQYEDLSAGIATGAP